MNAILYLVVCELETVLKGWFIHFEIKHRNEKLWFLFFLLPVEIFPDKMQFEENIFLHWSFRTATKLKIMNCRNEKLF